MKHVIIASLAALILVGAGASAVVAPDAREAGDDCSTNNQETLTCVQVGTDESPVILYIDAGRADDNPGIWQESNDAKGLQKEPFGPRQDETPADTDLLA